MSEQLDTKALRAMLDEYDRLSPDSERDVQRSVRIGCAFIDAAPLLLDAAEERDELRASASRLIDEIKRLTYSVRDERAERDALRARVAEIEREVGRVREALSSAATSLRTISLQAGRELEDMLNVRGYANSRAGVAFAALTPSAPAHGGGGEAC